MSKRVEKTNETVNSEQFDIVYLDNENLIVPAEYMVTTSKLIRKMHVLVVLLTKLVGPELEEEALDLFIDLLDAERRITYRWKNTRIIPYECEERGGRNGRETKS